LIFLVKIAKGKDVSVVAVDSYFGNVTCVFIKIECKFVALGFIPFNGNNFIFFSYIYNIR